MIICHCDILSLYLRLSIQFKQSIICQIQNLFFSRYYITQILNCCSFSTANAGINQDIFPRSQYLRLPYNTIILCFKRIYNHSTRFLQKCANRNSNPFLPSGERNAPEDKHSFIVRGMFFVFCIHLFHRFYKISIQIKKLRLYKFP